MKLLTAAILKSLPKLYSQEKVKDPIARVKFFNPCGMGTWFATEFDGEDRFFGWAVIHPGCGELGYFSLSELSSVRIGFGLGIERDMYFTPCPLSEAIKEYDI